jgi:hypothetical protein
VYRDTVKFIEILGCLVRGKERVKDGALFFHCVPDGGWRTGSRRHVAAAVLLPMSGFVKGAGYAPWRWLARLCRAAAGGMSRPAAAVARVCVANTGARRFARRFLILSTGLCLQRAVP